MPSTIPGLVHSAASVPGGHASQHGCIECLRDGEVGPLEIVYTFGGFSLCMSHAREALNKHTQ